MPINFTPADASSNVNQPDSVPVLDNKRPSHLVGGRLLVGLSRGIVALLLERVLDSSASSIDT